MTPSIPPTSKTWTLRFKHNRTTILLHADPLQPLPALRAELLKAVRQSHPNGTLNGHIIPDSPEDVLLAVPIDTDDLSAGWEALEKNEREREDGDLFQVGKGKEKAVVATKGRSKKDAGLTDCPQGAGLRDGGMVAFKFHSETGGEKDGARAVDEEQDADDEKLDGETLVGEPARELWDVVVPTMEETYGDAELPLESK